ncbi:MAG: calcium-translocating P-type ATPase, PMCA-type [Candidatus Aenigmarchaeota archaeon]|nr:calcium-translocating P-type ATPase, PMCA-type [Candidatus Aenigmarchaeota archaeon]
MEWHTLKAQQIFKELKSSENGLAEAEARKRLQEQGPNELTKEKVINPIALFAGQFKNFLVIILLAAAFFSFGLGAEHFLDGTVILIIVILNATFGFVQEFRAGKAIEALKKLTSPESIVLRGGKKKIPSRLLVPGDIVFLEEGSKVPADIRLLETANLQIDEASLTGESVPVSKSPEPLGKAILAERRNMVFMGTHATYGRGNGVVVATGMETEIGKIAHLIQEAEPGKTPLQKQLGRFSKSLGILILVISVAVILGGILRSYPAMDMVLTGIALAVAAIPEGLPAVVTITLALGLRRLSGRNALVRRLPAVEALGSTSIICADKTGTLTRGEMAVRMFWTSGAPEEFLGKKAKDPHTKLLLRTGGLCNNASFDNGKLLGDPTEGAILQAALEGGASLNFKRVEEIPFSSERKMMSTVNIVDGKQIIFAKGAPEVLLGKCSHILRNGKEVKLGKKERREILQVNESFAKDALRVLGFAYKTVAGKAKEKDLVFLGLMGMIDPPRSGVKKDVLVCKRAGIRTVMITGDHKNTAVAIAKEIGIYQEGDRVLTGEELDKLGEKEFRRVVEKVSVYARVNPSHKVRIVDAFKRKGDVVAMTGDGVNDAPALKRADIGVAMGIKGTDVAKEASDMILTDDNFSSIVSAVREGRGVYDNISHFIRYLLSSNIAEVLIIFLALLFFFSPGQFLIPLLAVQILWVNLVTDGLPALALGVDPPARGIMSRKPRPAKERLLSRQALEFILFTGAIITAGTLWIFASELPNLAKAQTMAFSCLVMFEMFNVFNVRSRGVGFFSNRKLLLAVGGSILLQLLVVYLPPLQTAFGTVALSLGDWAKIILVSVTILVAMTIKRRINH